MRPSRDPEGGMILENWLDMDMSVAAIEAKLREPFEGDLLPDEVALLKATREALLIHHEQGITHDKIGKLAAEATIRFVADVAGGAVVDPRFDANKAKIVELSYNRHLQPSS